MSRVLVALLGLLYLSAGAHAQERLPPDPKPRARPPAHKFFDTANIALTGAEVTALLADGIYTQRLNTVPGPYEADALVDERQLIAQCVALPAVGRDVDRL